MDAVRLVTTIIGQGIDAHALALEFLAEEVTLRVLALGRRNCHARPAAGA